MRIVAGSFKGTKLNSFDGKDIRPTLDKVREAIFSSIAEYVPNANVLDLFGGTAAMSLEAISRGANSAIVLDNSIEAIKIIKENIEKTKTSNCISVLQTDAKKYLQGYNGETFDLIFVDPPYHQGLYDEVLEIVDNNKILSGVGVLVIEHPSDIKIKEFRNLVLLKEKSYGKIVVSYYVAL